MIYLDIAFGFTLTKMVDSGCWQVVQLCTSWSFAVSPVFNMISCCRTPVLVKATSTVQKGFWTSLPSVTWIFICHSNGTKVYDLKKGSSSDATSALLPSDLPVSCGKQISSCSATWPYVFWDWSFRTFGLTLLARSQAKMMVISAPE